MFTSREVKRKLHLLFFFRRSFRHSGSGRNWILRVHLASSNLGGHYLAANRLHTIVLLEVFVQRVDRDDELTTEVACVN